MQRLITRFPSFRFLMLAALLASPACSTAPAAASATVTPASVTVQQAVTFGAGPFTLSDPKTGLSGLASYKATLTVAFDGTQDGQPSKSSRKYVMLASKDPAFRQWNIDTAAGAAGSTSEYMAELEGADYDAQSKDACTASPIEPGQSLSDTLEPAGFLHFVVGAEAAGSGKANGVPADHYKFDEHALGQENLTQSTGELWIASDGGYVVKYLLTSTAGEDYFGTGTEGTVTWDYEVTDIGKPVKLSLPPGCPGGMVDAPLLPDPSNELNSPGLLSYQTSSSLADAAAFYEKQMPDLGWKPVGDPDVSDVRISMLFQQSNENLSIVIADDSGATSVNIVLTRTQQ
jgi:hypothetical protein